MAKKKQAERTKYRTIQVPEHIVKLTLELIPGLYRTHHEAMIEWIRLGLYELITYNSNLYMK